MTGRALAALTVADLLAGRTGVERVRMVKLASAKHRGFAATRVPNVAQAQALVGGLPPATVLLVADDYLDCDSEYRTFTVGREVVASSPYLVEGESWSRELVQHRASFHVEATAFVADVLANLPDDLVPPACVLDVARLPSGEFRLLEANTAWGCRALRLRPGRRPARGPRRERRHLARALGLAAGRRGAGAGRGPRAAQLTRTSGRPGLGRRHGVGRGRIGA